MGLGDKADLDSALCALSEGLLVELAIGERTQ
jgi:hypothetical protein